MGEAQVVVVDFLAARYFRELRVLRDARQRVETFREASATAVRGHFTMERVLESYGVLQAEPLPWEEVAEALDFVRQYGDEQSQAPRGSHYRAMRRAVMQVREQAGIE